MARAKASAQVYKSRRSVRISSRTNGEQKGESEDQTDEQDLAVSSSKAKNSLTKRLRGGGDTGKKSSKKPRMELNGGWISDDNNTAEEGNPSSEEEKAVTLEEQRKSNEELFRKLYEANYVDEAKKTLLEVAEDTTRKSARNRGIGELPSKR
ncbi:unnamed protein product [Cyprideis torosa]|uniref:Uncharacterized protein n=1 Tax=Cyprideis torosa TaxID=163714 RepID=A0A7R8WSJ2_9CRUS|nr:unnamed protein product [Cyprideis torosa]CAG0903822.1 unnamed protein product [Cyprideis torosa]